MRRMTERKFSNALMWSLIFVTTSFLPYSFVLGKAGYASILEPKFFYVGGIGISIIVAIGAYFLFYTFSKQKILTIISLLFFGWYLTYHFIAVRTKIGNLVEIGTLRKTFLENIKSTYVMLPQRVIFYIQSDTAYYGMVDSEKILPVQVGFGKMLMIWYQKGEHFPGCLYEGQFLLGLLEEGYQDCDGRGFGFARKYESLLRIIQENKLGADNIIAYSWNGNTQQFRDTTSETRTRLNREAK